MHRRGWGRRRRKGFIVIVGWRVISTREDKPPVIGTCPQCGVEDAQLIGRVRRAWFTMFFIPLIPLDSAERAQRISQCCACKHLFEMPIEQLARRARAGGGAADFSTAIALYNTLRDRPDDGRTMLRLLQTYEAMGEVGEAESVAKLFPNAIAADPACETVLRRLRAGAT